MAGTRGVLAGIGLYYNNPAFGLDGNKAWKKQAEIRKEASQSIKDKNEIIKEHWLLLKQIKEHDIIGSKKTAENIVKILRDGLQTTYNIMFEEFLLLKEKLEKDEAFLMEKGNKFTKEELKLYHDEFLVNVSIVLDEIRLNMVSDLINSIRYNGFGAYRIETMKNERPFIRSIFEIINAKSLIKGLYREEGNITLFEEGKRIRNVLMENKLYYTDFIGLTRKMLLYDLILISNAYKAADAMQKAVDNYDLIKSYTIYPDMIITLLQDDAVKSFRNLNKSLIQLKSILQKSIKTVNKLLEEKRENSKNGNNIKQKA